MTYEQLQKVSGIHRNSLRRRLDELTKSGLVIKHKYQLPKNDLYYGNSSQHVLCKDYPDCRYYYLLNIHKAHTADLLSRHYVLDELDSAIEEINAIKEKCTDKKEQQDLETKLRSLRHYRLVYSQPKIENEKIKEIATRPIEATNAVDRSILKYKLNRELKILCVSFRQRINNLHDNDKFEIMLVDTYLDNLIEFADHIVRFGYSLFDLIIRCCNGIIISTKHIQRGDISPKFVLFPMITYRQLLFLVRITKYGKELLKMFGVKINAEIKNNAYGSEHPLVKLKREQISLVDSIMQIDREQRSKMDELRYVQTRMKELKIKEGNSNRV